MKDLNIYKVKEHMEHKTKSFEIYGGGIWVRSEVV